MVALGQARIRAILDYYDALPEQEQPAYLQRIRATLQVSPLATQDEMLAAMREYANPTPPQSEAPASAV